MQTASIMTSYLLLTNYGGAQTNVVNNISSVRTTGA